MSRRALTNTFAFETRCMVCDQENRGGLRQRFFLDEELGRVASAAMGNTFVVKALDLLRRGGRLGSEDGATAADVPVLALRGEGVKVVGIAKTLD